MLVYLECSMGNACVFVCLGYVTKYQRLGGLNYKSSFSHHSRGWKCWQDWFLVDLSSWLADGPFLAVSSHGLSSVPLWRDISGASFSYYKDTSPIG